MQCNLPAESFEGELEAKIVPTLLKKHFLEECSDSLVANTLSDKKIILL